MVAAALLVFAQITVTVSSGKASHADSVKRARELAHEDTVAVRMDSIRTARDSFRLKRREARHIPLTPELLASAFKDPGARVLLDRARAARLTQDSALQAYDATAYERLSVNMKITSLGRNRLLFRTERATRVKWERGNGAVVDVTGERSALPMLSGADVTDVDRGGDGGIPLPYYPGRETLWIGSQLAKADADASEMIHPLGNGAEAYYTYATGDSVSFHLPGGKVILVRELRVQPRKSAWNLVVGSLWFDVATGQLVRGVFRMAEPMNVMSVAKQEDGEDPRKDIPAWIKPMILPMTGGIDVMTVDYGLYEGRFWLPRMQTAEGKARAGVMRFPFELRQVFDYESVNATLKLPQIQLSVIDTASGIAARRERRISRDSACANGAQFRETTRLRDENQVPMIVRIPCDTAALARSPTLPKSIYDSPDSLFGDKDIDALTASALSLQRQAGAGFSPPVVQSGLAMTRYNRVEGISSGIRVDDEMGSGYSSHALARLGLDLSPDAELGVSRTNGRETYGVNVYRRLNSANDLGRDPFSLSSSLSAFLFGRDDGVYYRSWGAELVHDEQSGLLSSWRLFGEQEFGASATTHFSLGGKLGGGYFPDNIAVSKGSVVGISLIKTGSMGEDPAGLRILSDVRVDGAAGTFDYTRAMADVTVMHPLGANLDASLTLSGGTSGGTVPAQRLWYLGGTSTVRGQDVGVQVGDAYWLSRLELGLGKVFARPVIFGDLGWAGDRHDWNQAVVPVSGAGIGGSFMDGLIRLDLARGIRPSGGVQASLYLDARF
jgi:hypothetical protein